MKNIRFRKGEIVLVDFGQGKHTEKSGIRPAVIISSDKINRTSSNVIVAPLTKSNNKKSLAGNLNLLGTHVYLSKLYYPSLDYSSVVQLEDMRSISKRRVIENLTTLSKENFNEINSKIRRTFDL